MSQTEKTARTVETRRARLAATQDRMSKREASALDALKRAEDGLKKAQERVAKAKAKLEKVRTDARTLIQKQAQELRKSEERHSQAVRREQEKHQKVSARRPTAAAGTVETEAGEARELTPAVAETVKRVIGRKREGLLSAQGDEAKALLDALDATGNVGETFEIRLNGRKTGLLFVLQADGLAFETVSLAVAA